MSDWFENIKSLIGEGKVKKALDELSKVSENFNTEIELEIITLRSRWNNLQKDIRLGRAEANDKETNKITIAILELLREIKTEYSDFGVENNETAASEEARIIPLNQEKQPLQETQTEEKSSLDEIQEAVAILKQKQLTHNTTEEEAKEIQDLKQKVYKELFGELDEATENIPQVRAFQSGIYFDKIFTSPKLDKVILQEIDTIRRDKKKYQWYDRSLIVSALTVSLINHKFDGKKLGLLIDFLTDFEEKVWQRALVGLVMGLLFHKNRINRFQYIVERLRTLQNLPQVQESLKIIDLIFLHKLYKQTLFNPKAYQFPFFSDNPKNCFLPFYKNNPILEEALEQAKDEEFDLDFFIDFVNNLPLLNAHKYFLTTALKANQVVIEKMEKKETVIFENTLNLSHYFHPYQNFITEIYLFYSFYPKSNIKNLFDKEMSLADVKLRDIILAEKEKLFIKARTAFKNEKYTQAIENCDKLLEINPDDWEALDMIADSYFHIENYNKAQTYYEELIENKKENLGKYNNHLGITYSRQKKYEKALKFFKQAVEIEPKNADYLNNLGGTYRGLKDYEKALKFFKQAVEIEPKNANFLNSLGVSYRDIKEYKKALEYKQQAVEIEPKNADYLNNLGGTYRDLKKYEEALNYFKQAVEIEPKNAIYLSWVGLKYVYLNNLIEAEKTLLKALDIESTKQVNEALGHLELKKGNNEKAIQYYKKSIELANSIEDFEEYFDNEATHLEDLGIDLDIYNQIKEEVIEWYKNKQKE